MKCETHTFDPTMIGMKFKGEEYSTFHPWGLGAEGEVVPFTRKEVNSNLSFDTIIKKLGHQHRHIDVVKIDCEGCEYTAMPPLCDAIATGQVKVDQILIEMHTRWSERGRLLFPVFEALDKAKMRIFHKERNQWGCSGRSCVEYAFASEEFLRKVNGNMICPEGGV